MITKDQIHTGDTFLVTNPKDFVPRQICAVMRQWAKKKGYDKLPDYNPKFIFSHAARFAWIAGELYLFGSIDSGYKPILFRRHYNFDKDYYIVMRRKAALSDTEKDQTINQCIHLVTVSGLYQFWNFVQWLALVYLDINLFKKDSDKFTYCYEGERMARKDLNPENYGDTYQTDLFQLVYDPNYEIIENHTV
jgi:hypothetical protein